MVQVEFLNFHGECVNYQQFVVNVVNAQTTNESQIVHQFHQTITHGESVQSTDLVFNSEDISNMIFIEHGSEEKTSLEVAFGIIETEIFVVQFSQNSVNSDDMVIEVPFHQHEFSSTSNNEFVVGSLHWDDEWNFVNSIDFSSDGLLVIPIEFQDSPIEHVSVEKALTFIIPEWSESNQIVYCVIDAVCEHFEAFSFVIISMNLQIRLAEKILMTS